MVRTLGIAFGGLVVLFVMVGFFLPAKTVVSQSVEVAAKPGEAFETLNSLHQFNEWSPWAKMEPLATYTFDGPPSGPGAKMSWDGEKIGRGSQTIVSSTPGRIDLTLTFDGQGGGKTWFEIKPADDGVEVVWTFESDPYSFNIIGRYIGAFFVDGMLTKQYAEGLADYKVYQEAKESVSTPAER